jgi:hypothetical protein
MTRKDVYDRAVTAPLTSGNEDDETIRLRELGALVQLGLGHPLDAATFGVLVSLQARLRAAQSELALKLDAGLLLPEEYLDRLNVALQEWVSETRGVLGTDAFDAVFGDAGRNPTGLVDRDTFVSETPPLSAH